MSGALPADLDPARLAAALSTRRLGRSLEVRATTTSTMDDARAAADAGAPHGHVVVADAQTAGRGARGRRWSSPPGTDLYLSFVWRPEAAAAQAGGRLGPAELPLATLAIGLAVAEAAEVLIGGAAAAQVDWPNDVRLDGRKCAGVLVESVGSGPLVCGVGLDVDRVEFPDELASLATSLARVAGRPIGRTVAFGALLDAVERRLDRFAREGAAGVVADLEARLAHRGERVRVDGGVEGVVRGLAHDGALLLEDRGETHRILAGRVEPA